MYQLLQTESTKLQILIMHKQKKKILTLKISARHI